MLLNRSLIAAADERVSFARRTLAVHQNGSVATLLKRARYQWLRVLVDRELRGINVKYVIEAKRLGERREVVMWRRSCGRVLGQNGVMAIDKLQHNRPLDVTSLWLAHAQQHL